MSEPISHAYADTAAEHLESMSGQAAAGLEHLADHADQAASKGDAVQSWVMHHVQNSDSWHLPGLEPIPLGGLTMHGLMVIIGAVAMVVVFGLLYRKDARRAPSGLTNLLEVFVVYVRDEICVPNLGADDGKRMTPVFCSFFFFILFLNLLGMVPVFATATGNVNVTGALATLILGIMILGTITKNGIGGFVKAFVPHGVPWPLLILLTPIEFIGIFIKCFALMIRLFANMFAGHTVILTMLGLVVTYGVFGLPAIVLALAISLMEVGIALLQAYIFTLLSAMFIGQLYHPAH